MVVNIIKRYCCWIFNILNRLCRISRKLSRIIQEILKVFSHSVPVMSGIGGHMIFLLQKVLWLAIWEIQKNRLKWVKTLIMHSLASGCLTFHVESRTNRCLNSLYEVFQEMHPVCFRLSIQRLRYVHLGVNSKIKYSKAWCLFSSGQQTDSAESLFLQFHSCLFRTTWEILGYTKFHFFKHWNCNKINN